MATQNAINSQDPIQVALGGTGSASFTAYAPIVGGTTTTGPFQSASNGMSNTSQFVLTSNGSSAIPSFQVSGGTAVLLNTQTALVSSDLTFTSTYITSSYSSYMILGTLLIPSGTNVQLFMDMSVDNGSNYLSSNYICGGNTVVYSSTTQNNSNSTTSCPLSLAAQMSPAAPARSLQMFLYNLATASAIPSFTGACVNNVQVCKFFGYNTGSVNVNNLRFMFNSGTITSGTLSIYGILK